MQLVRSVICKPQETASWLKLRICFEQLEICRLILRVNVLLAMVVYVVSSIFLSWASANLIGNVSAAACKVAIKTTSGLAATLSETVNSNA